MSMIYCHKHDRHIDTDWYEDCPECLAEIYEAEEVEPLTTVELIRPRDVEIGRVEPSLWTLCGKSISEASKSAHTIPERDHGRWYVIYQSTDMLRVMEDAMDLQRNSGGHFAYAVAMPYEVKTDD